MFSKNAFVTRNESEIAGEEIAQAMPTGPMYYRDCEASESEITFRGNKVPSTMFKHPDGRTFSMPNFVISCIEGLAPGTLFRKSSIETMLKAKAFREHHISSDAHDYCRFTEALHLGCSSNPGWLFFMAGQEANEDGVKGRWFRHPTQEELNGNIRSSEMLTRRGTSAEPRPERMPSESAIANARRILERIEKAQQVQV